MDTEQNKHPLPPYDLDKAQEREVKVRGEYLTMSCDIEYCLVNITLFCNPTPDSHERVGKFIKMTMGEKINNVICDMKKYKMDDYLLNQKYFDGLEEFRKIRNHAAHDKAEFMNKELEPIRFTFLDTETKGAKEWGKYAELPALYITQSLERFGAINHYLGLLWMKYQNEYYKTSNTHPFAHPSTYTDKTAI